MARIAIWEARCQPSSVALDGDARISGGKDEQNSSTSQHSCVRRINRSFFVDVGICAGGVGAEARVANGASLSPAQDAANAIQSGLSKGLRQRLRARSIRLERQRAARLSWLGQVA